MNQINKISLEINKISLEVVSEIKTKGRPRAMVRNGYAHIYTPKDTAYYENLIKLMYKQKYGAFQFEDGTPLEMTVIAHFKLPSGLTKYHEYVGDELPFTLACVKNKDVDNIAKICMDALNGIAMTDDKHIVSLASIKEWTNEQERVEIYICKSGFFSSLSEIDGMYKDSQMLEKIKKLESMPKRTKAQEERLNQLKKEWGKDIPNE